MLHPALLQFLPVDLPLGPAFVSLLQILFVLWLSRLLQGRLFAGSAKEEAVEEADGGRKTAKPDAPVRQAQGQQCHRQQPLHPRPMLLFTPSAGTLFGAGSVQQRRKVMSEPQLMAITEGAHEEGHSPGVAASLLDFQQIPAELWLTRRRIEAGVREQQKQREILTQVQERLAQCRLGRAQHWAGAVEASPRARSHSPPVDWREEPIPLPERPSTSHMGRHQLAQQEGRFDGDEHLFGGEKNGSQFRLRLSLLERQMERLSALAGQTVAAKLATAERRQQEEVGIGSARMRHRARELGQEAARLRRRLAQLRETTREEMEAARAEVEQSLRAFGRRLRREIATSRQSREQRANVQLERVRTEAETLRVERQKLLTSRDKSENRAELAEQRLQQVLGQLWAIPILSEVLPPPVGSVSPESTAVSFSTAIRAAITRAEQAEARRWTEELELAKERAKEEMREERRKHRETLERERREVQRIAEQRQTETTTERARINRELERTKAEAEEAKARLDAAESEARKAREEAVRAREISDSERTAKERLGAELALAKTALGMAEGEKHRMVEELAMERAAREGIEGELAKEREARQNVDEQLRQQQREAAVVAEELRTNSARLARAEKQLTGLAIHSQELAKAKQENQQLAEKVAEAEFEMETLKEKLENAEQRLRAERALRDSEGERADREWQAQSLLLAKEIAQKEELAHALANAEQRLADVEKSDSERTAREQRLRAELAKTEALLADERELAEEATAEFERRTLAEIEKLRTELAAKEVALEEALERAEELADRLGEAEHRLAKAGELCRRLNAELDELSERSLTQNSSTEKLRAELEDANGELALLRARLEEQRRRNSQLEAELRGVENANSKERQKAEAEFGQQLEAEADRWREELKQQEAHIRTREENRMEQLLERWTRRCKEMGLERIDVALGKGGTSASAVERMDSLWSALLTRIEWQGQRLEECHRERESLTAQLASTRQLLLSQQSELSARESESQKLRAKLTRTEMAKAEREARAREEHEMAEAGLDKLKAGLEREKDQLEQELARERAELAKQRAKLQSAQSNEEELRIKVQNLEAQLTETMRQLEEQKQRIGKGRMAGDLVEVRKANEIMKERDKLRNELAEIQRKLQAATQKVVQLQERLDGADEERTVAIRRAELAERRESECKAMEATLRSELHELRLDWRKSVQEADQTKRALREAEAIRKELEAQLLRCQRDGSARQQHIEALEMDRRRVEAVIRQTTLERNALEKSLGAMERENAELQRHCSSLQAQVERLVREGEDRVQQRERRCIGQLEAELSRAGQEKRRLEKLLGQRESSQEVRIGLLESRLERAQAELEAERRRRKQSLQPK